MDIIGYLILVEKIQEATKTLTTYSSSHIHTAEFPHRWHVNDINIKGKYAIFKTMELPILWTFFCNLH